MSKGLFDIIFKLRPLAREGKITRDQALEMLQGSGATSAQMETAVQNLFKDTQGRGSGIISLEKGADLVRASEKATEPTKVSDNFDSILDNLGTLEELNDESLQALARESKVLGNSIKQLENMRDNSEEYVLMTNRKKKVDNILDVANMIPRSKNTSFEDSLESWKRANKDRSLLISTKEENKFFNEQFDYQRAQYQQAIQRKLKPFYEKYGAKTEADKKFIEDFYDVDVDEGATLKKHAPSYMFVDVRTYLDEATEDILGMSKDLRTDILYGREASKYVNSQDIKGFIKYAKQRYMDEGVSINDKMLNKVVDDMYVVGDVDDAFATGGRVGFKKGLSQALIDMLNDIAPGSTKVGGLSKEMSEKALRKKAERELAKEVADFNTRNSEYVEIDGKVYKTSDKNRPATEDEMEEYASILDPTGEVGIDAYTIKELDEAVKKQLDYEKEMYRQYKAGELDKYAPSPLENISSDQIRAAVDDIFPTGDYKYDATMAAESLVENNPKVFGNKLFEDLDDRTRSKVYGAVVDVIMRDNAKMRKLSKPTKTLESMKKTGSINISDPEVAEEFARYVKETDPEGAKKLEETVELMNFDTKGRKKNANGGLNYLMGLD